MVKLLTLGILSGAFFSSTFLLNELMSLSGGHWVWSAVLRYAFMLSFLLLILLAQGGIKRLQEVFALFRQHYFFWMLSGGIGFGLFYTLLCFSADFSPAWVIASTWQFTVVATLFVLLFFGKQFPRKVWFFSGMIFFGVCLVNLSHIDNFEFKSLLLGGIPVLIASFCYPLGNQLVWEAKNGGYKRVPYIDSTLLHNVFNKVVLMSLGAVPVLIILVLITQPPAPTPSQYINTALVALFSGLCATTLFLYARGLAKDTSEIAAVDATQASEVLFALLGGLLFLGASMPSFITFIGLALILVGLLLFTKYQKQS